MGKWKTSIGHLVIVPYTKKVGENGGVLVVCTETTNSVLNLKKNEESENKSRFVIDVAELGNWDFNPHTNTFEGNDQGKPAKLIEMILYITEHKQCAEELSKQVKEHTAELKQTNSDLLQFGHVASHDLKEPVRKIKIFTGRIKYEFKNELLEKVHVYLEKIQHSTYQMLSMIEGVLMYSTLSNLNLVMEKVNLNVIIENIQKDLEILIEEKKAKIATDVLPMIDGVPVFIHQLFYSLINNALKFSKNNEASHITIKYKQEQVSGIDYGKIIVTDNGIGFF